jgi:ECF sigma factor
MRTTGAVTRILSAIEGGDPHATEQLLPLVYVELRKLAARKLAREKPGQTLQATALVHEDYLRLVEVVKVQLWNSRDTSSRRPPRTCDEFSSIRAREEQGCKREGKRERVDFRQPEAVTTAPPDALLALDEPCFFPMFGYQPGPGSD